VSAVSLKRFVLIGLAVFLVAFFVIWAAAEGIDKPEVPSGDVAVVDDAPGGPITQEEFDSSLQQAAASQGGQVPNEDDPQYEALKEQALSDLLLGRWVEGEASEQGLTATDSEVTQRLDQIKKQNFEDEKEFQRFLDQSGLSEEDAVQRVRLTLLSERVQEDVLSGQGEEVDSGVVEAFYEENASQFEQPEARDVRVILNEDQAKVEQARAALEQDDSSKGWNEAAKQFSSDQATKTEGGLRQGLVEGQGEATFDEQVFGAEEGELVGPFESDEGFYLIQVQSVKEAETTSLDEAREQITQQITGAQQQLAVSEFESDFVDKWTERTFCAPDFVIERCANAPPPARSRSARSTAFCCGA
jgi:parvulin-like peptidyl-prolyl isomerase